MADPQPKRFYKAVDTAPEAGGVAVRLDGRLPKSPAGKRLVLSTPALAELIAAEWAGQGEFIVAASMPATRLAYTALDHVSAAREATAGEVARFVGSDLLCYFAEHPRGLVERQTQAWGPVLDWAQALGLALNRVAGIQHIDQPPQTLERARALAAEGDDFALTALAHASGLFGSAVLAFALQRGRLSGAEAFELSRLDEAFQEALWGLDAEAAERTANMAAEAAMLDRWFAALR